MTQIFCISLALFILADATDFLPQQFCVFVYLCTSSIVVSLLYAYKMCLLTIHIIMLKVMFWSMEMITAPATSTPGLVAEDCRYASRSCI